MSSSLSVNIGDTTSTPRFKEASDFVSHPISSSPSLLFKSFFILIIGLLIAPSDSISMPIVIFSSSPIFEYFCDGLLKISFIFSLSLNDICIIVAFKISSVFSNCFSFISSLFNVAIIVEIFVSFVKFDSLNCFSLCSSLSNVNITLHVNSSLFELCIYSIFSFSSLIDLIIASCINGLFIFDKQFNLYFSSNVNIARFL